MKRYQDWPERLRKYIDQRLTRQMEWGKNDCVLFTAGAIEAMSGSDPAHWCRGEYASKVGAMRQVALLGCRTFQEATIKCCDEIMRRKPLTQNLEAGDIVLADIENLDPTATGPTTGVIDFSGGMLVPGQRGLCVVDDMEVQIVWSL